MNPRRDFSRRGSRQHRGEENAWCSPIGGQAQAKGGGQHADEHGDDGNKFVTNRDGEMVVGPVLRAGEEDAWQGDEQGTEQNGGRGKAEEHPLSAAVAALDQGFRALDVGRTQEGGGPAGQMTEQVDPIPARGQAELALVESGKGQHGRVLPVIA